MSVGDLVYYWALGRNGIIIDGSWISTEPPILSWDWCVLFDDGELGGADTDDLKVVENESR